MKKVLLILLLLIPLALAQEETSDLYHAKNLYIDFDIDGSIEIQGTPQSVVSMDTELYLFPRESYRQEVISIDTTPKANAHSELYNFHWSSPAKVNPFEMKTKLKTTNEFKRITSKVSFPFDVPKEYEQYTKPTDKIDSDNTDIIRLANDLANGEDDLFVLEVKMANYVKDTISYNLSTLTEEASQSASWVLTNKYGVCDELTNLFIAMNRAVGIPARFVKGISYTNSPLFNYEWGPHAWAEVYFPSYGWVPFDITYAEFGFIDATHIELDYSDDSDTPSTRFVWKAVDGPEIVPSALNFDQTVTKQEGSVAGIVTLASLLMNQDVGQDSFNAVETVIKNPNPYYVPVTVLITRTQGIRHHDPYSRRILLKPHSEEKLFWKFELTENLRKGYSYNFPIHVYTLNNISSDMILHATRKDTVFDEQSIDYWIGTRDIKESKALSKDVDFICTSPSNVYKGEDVNVNCSIKNKGNVMLNDIDVCLGSDCNSVNLGISQDDSIDFIFSAELNKIYTVSAKSDDIDAVTDLQLVVLDFPEVAINDLTIPDNLTYEQEFQIKFVAESLSNSPAYEVKASIIADDKILQEWSLEQLSEYQEFILTLHGKDLRNGENNIVIRVDYKDNNKKSYSVEESAMTELVGLNIWQRFILFLKNLF